MSTARSSQTSILLQTGKVLVVGGYDNSGYTAGSAELYNPSTGAFSNFAVGLGSLGACRTIASAIGQVLGDGRGFVAGGARYEGGCGIGAVAGADVPVSAVRNEARPRRVIPNPPETPGHRLA